MSTMSYFSIEHLPEDFSTKTFVTADLKTTKNALEDFFFAFQQRVKTEVAQAVWPQPETIRVMMRNKLICQKLGEQIRSVHFQDTMRCLSVCFLGWKEWEIKR